MFMGHPTYILHDGVIVPASEAQVAAEQLRMNFEGYCIQMGWPLRIRPSVTQERDKTEVAQRLPMVISESP
jgi:hypothetical protein